MSAERGRQRSPLQIVLVLCQFGFTCGLSCGELADVRFLCRVPVPGMETHIPVLFLDLSGTFSFPLRLSAKDNFSIIDSWFSFLLSCSADDFQASLSAPLSGGLDALLCGEEEDDDDDFFDLHIVKHYDSGVS